MDDYDGELWTLGKCHSKQTSPRIFVCGVVLVFYLASYSITDKESKIFLIFIGVVGDECMLILSLARHIATTYINTGPSQALLLHQASDIILTPDTFIDHPLSELTKFLYLIALVILPLFLIG